MTTAHTNEIVSYGDLVQWQRTVLGLTRPELARRVNCSPVTIKKIERDERRPSRQLAELLAEHLLIPDADRDKFIRMARGELTASTISSENLVSQPAFLRLPGSFERSDDPPFVARESELAQLEAHLDAAMAGDGRVVFITGEAGDGKTRLAHAFIRDSQEKHPSLVAAHGNCDAYTGIGDPYLPFREILSLLTGDIEAQWVAGNMSQRYAQRLWHLIPHAVEALLAVGPDLVDVFIPGSTLLSRVEAAVPAQGDLLARLDKLVARHLARTQQIHVQQSDLLGQYARVLQALARGRPLLLVVDDLQWADAGSIGLLFHLARRLSGHRILLLGLYRPSDVSLGRQGERHPLTSVVNEVRRKDGDVRLDLSETEGRQFVDALLDAERNQFNSEFRDSLCRRTAGHPLFTVEMLRGLRDRGDLVTDAEGVWSAGAELNWRDLPARVEGVIQERIDRLPPDLREILKIASVEGEVFTAEVAARVQGLEAGELIRSIGSVLHRQHRLVTSHDQQHLERIRLSRYRFRHILFQQYLYNTLDQAERVYLHRAVGDAMEQLVGEQADSIAPQLARHFDLGAEDGRARRYYATAGRVAAAAHAHREAISHYRRAITIAKRSNAGSETIGTLYLSLGRSLELVSQFDQALATYEELEDLARDLDARDLELDALTAQVTLLATFTPAHDPVRAEALADQALALARQLGAEAAEAKVLWLMIFVYNTTNRLAMAIEAGERSLSLARRLGLRELMAYILNDLGSHVFLVAGPFTSARAALDEATEYWQELNNLPMLANSIAAASLVRLYAGEYDESLEHSDRAYEITRSIDNLWGQSYSRLRAGYAYWERGEPDRAIDIMEECIRNGERAGFMAPQADTRALLAYVQGNLGAMEQALETAALAVEIAEQHVPPFRTTALGILAQLHLLNGDLAAANTAIAQGKADPYATGWPLHFMPVRMAECELALELGDVESAASHADKLLIDLRQMGARMFVPRTLFFQGRAYLGMGRSDIGLDILMEARREAEEIGSLPSLWPILFSLSELEPDAAESASLLRQTRNLLRAIAAKSPTPALRTSFLELPSVRAVFTG